jgi:TatD DNase family protein
MIWIDTHCHLYSEEFNEDRSAALKRAMDQGIQRIYLPAIDSESHQALLDLEAAHPDHCFAMMGLHPCSVGDDPTAELEVVLNYWKQHDFVAVGEIGIDLYWRKDNLEQQKHAFRTQIAWAVERNKPFVIHCREAFEEVFSVLDEFQGTPLKGIFHCFSGTLEQAKRAISYGLFLGIGGVITYKKAGVAEVIQNIPLSHLVLETDAPYLPPTPHRGKRNEPAFLLHTAEKLSEVTGAPLSRIASMTSENALSLFHGKQSN